MRTPITAVFFDFDHTLGVDNRLEERVLRLLAERHCSFVPADAQITAALLRFRTGSVSLESMLTDSFRDWGYAGSVVTEYRSEALRLLPACLVPMPGATETLTALRSAGLTVSILTNGWTELQHAKAALIRFDGAVFASEETGAWKPDPRAFLIGAQQLGVDPTSSLYVGDSPRTDIAGAKAAGMLAAWARLEGQPYPEDVVRPDFTIDALDELIPLCLG